MDELRLVDRREFLAFGSSVGMTGLAGCIFRVKDESEFTDEIAVSLETFASSLSFPTAFEFLPNDDCLVCERDGRILYSSRKSEGNSLFLDIRGKLTDIEGEMGLLGIALHPDFTDNGRFYLRYSAPIREWMDDETVSHTFVVSEFVVNDGNKAADPKSERIILELPQPTSKHNAGDLVFSPGGNLYIGVGDGGEIGEQSAEGAAENWWYERGLTSQDTATNLLGGILRINVDDSTGGKEYSVPSDNPLVGKEGRDEYYAWGLRNPYKMSFDDDRLYVGDVGAVNREEIDVIEKGGNYGWPMMEGSSCSPTVSLRRLMQESPLNLFNPKGWLSTYNLLSPYKLCPVPADKKGDFEHPLIEYGRAGPRAVIGGYVYRGNDTPELQGHYVFGDLFAEQLFSASVENLDVDSLHVNDIITLKIDNAEGRLPGSAISFGEDHNDELYVSTTQPPYGKEHSGNIFKIEAS